MAGKDQLDWPSDEKLQELVALHGQRGAAEALGVARPTLQSRLSKRKLRTTKEPLTVEVDEVSEIEVLREKVQRYESEARKTRKQDVRDLEIIQNFREATARVKPRYRPRVFKAKEAASPHEHVLLLSDLHAGEVVTEEEVLGLNSYNWQIMLDRLEKIQKSILSFQAHRPYPVKKLNVWMLGDMISGSIHEDLEVTNEFGHEQSVVQLGHDLAVWLEEFVPHYESISVSGVVGNHARRHRKPRAKRAATDNSDWTVYKFLEVYHRDNSAFDFNFPEAKFADTIVAGGWRALLIHGDGIRSTMVDVPFGGIIRYSQKLEAQFHKAGRPLDLICCGHWHTMNAVDGIGTKLYINGAVKGADEYSLQRFGSARPPGQLLLTMHPKRGVTDLSYLDCTDNVPNAQTLRAVA